MRYVPFPTVSWMGIDLREAVWIGEYGWMRGRGRSEDGCRVAGPRLVGI